MRKKSLFVLLVLALVLVLASCQMAPATHPPWEDLDGKPGELGLQEAVNLTRWLHKLTQAAGDPPRAPTQGDLTAWTFTFVPLYELEGVARRAVYPETVALRQMPTGRRWAFVAGVSDCEDYAVLNVRYANPHDTWYERGNYVAVLAHELAHVQQNGNCHWNTSQVIENAAQVASWEVLAALANDGNLEALQALLAELRGSALGVVRYRALLEHRPEVYLDLYRELFPGAQAAARLARNERYWSRRTSELQEILYKYEVRPWQLVLGAHEGNGTATLVLGWARPEDLELDDLIYLLSHGEAIANELQAKRAAEGLLG